MSRTTRKLNVLLALTVAVGLLAGLGATVIWAHDEDVKVIQRHEGTIRIVTEDQDGNREERTIEYDGDEPRAFLGVTTDEADGGGALVEHVINGTAAERAGLRDGDVIVGLDGDPIDDSWDLLQGVLALRPGDRVDLELLRDGQREELSVELGERVGHDFDFDFDFDFSGLEGLENLGEHLEGLGEHLKGLNFDIVVPDVDMPNLRFFGHHASRRPTLGVQLVQPTPELRRHLGAPSDAGVIVSKVLADMPAEDGGIFVGDLIVSADGREIEDAGDLIDALEDIDGETIELELIRDGASIRLDVFIPAKELEDEEAFDPEA